MVVQPKVRGFICTTSHPEGCRASVERQIAYVKAQPKTEGPKKVLVIGASARLWPCFPHQLRLFQRGGHFGRDF